MDISKKLLEKYNQAVPRYTSYPTANNFTDPLGAERYLELIELSNSRLPGNMAFYVHIPFCRKICYYCGCNSCRLSSEAEHLKYHEALKKEIRLVSSRLDKNRSVTQVHFGGGTPNAVPVEYLVEILSLFRSVFNFVPDAEIAVECNPALLNKKYIDRLKEAGFNRFSLGIQDFNKDVLGIVNRDPSAIPVDELIAYIHEGESKTAVNLDFIYGLPAQTATTFEETIKKAAEMRPDRLVTFSYAHVPWLKKNQVVLEKYGLPLPQQKVEMFLRAYNHLKRSGYMPVGFDHYVLPEDELYLALERNMLHRNFQGYCTRRTTGQVYAFGVSAISQLEPAYIQNVKSLKEYTVLLENNIIPVEKGRILNETEKITREIITHLMCNKSIDWEMMSEMLGASISVIKDSVRISKEALKGFADDGLIEFDDNNILVTETGSMFIRNIAASLDPAFVPADNKYSKSV